MVILTEASKGDW